MYRICLRRCTAASCFRFFSAEWRRRNKIAQVGFKKTNSRLQGEPNLAPRWFKLGTGIVPTWPRLNPEWPREAERPRRGPRMTEQTFLIASRQFNAAWRSYRGGLGPIWPQIGAIRPKRGPREAQERPKRGPTRVRNESTWPHAGYNDNDRRSANMLSRWKRWSQTSQNAKLDKSQCIVSSGPKLFERL